MGRGREQGVAYQFWLRLEQERVARGMTKLALSQVSGVNRQTIDNLHGGRRAPSLRVVYALADAVGIPRGEAAQLAGVLPAEPTGEPGDVRAAIEASRTYTEDQKAMLLAMVDTLDQVNAAARAAAERDRADRTV